MLYTRNIITKVHKFITLRMCLCSCDFLCTDTFLIKLHSTSISCESVDENKNIKLSETTTDQPILFYLLFEGVKKNSSIRIERYCKLIYMN